MRIIQAPGFTASDEPKNLTAFANVELRTIDFDQWYGSGILHVKMWIADGKVAYIGSANTDWKSLTQVKAREGGDLAGLTRLQAPRIGLKP